MTKIMLVEDDKSLREIYGVRLLAEGYDIISAGDGEEALAMAIKERPQLIISDVMMPKISGFDMLDILRSTTETKEIKVIMMTALSSEDQRNRGQSLGADKYLVKSQVGIEDVVRVVHEVLNDNQANPKTGPLAGPATPPQQVPGVTNMQPQTGIVPPTVAAPPVPPASSAVPPAMSQGSNGFTFQSAPVTTPAVGQPRPGVVEPARPAGSRNRVIEPLGNPEVAKIDINDLLDKELAKEAGVSLETPQPTPASIAPPATPAPAPTTPNPIPTQPVAPAPAPQPSMPPTPVAPVSPTPALTQTPPMPAPQQMPPQPPVA